MFQRRTSNVMRRAAPRRAAPRARGEARILVYLQLICVTRYRTNFLSWAQLLANNKRLEISPPSPFPPEQPNVPRVIRLLAGLSRICVLLEHPVVQRVPGAVHPHSTTNRLYTLNLYSPVFCYNSRPRHQRLPLYVFMPSLSYTIHLYLSVRTYTIYL